MFPEIHPAGFLISCIISGMMNNDRPQNPNSMRTYISLILLGSLFLFSSCLKEDREDCPDPVENLIIRFVNGLAPDASPIAPPEDSETADVFIFDEDGFFVTRLNDPNCTINPDYYLEPKLAPGRYTFVAWMNLKDCYTNNPDACVPGITHMDEMLLQFARDEDIYDDEPTLLFYGINRDFEVKEGGNQVVVIPLIPDNYRFNFTMKGYPFRAQHYRFQLHDNNKNYYFDNDFASSPEVQYSSLAIADDRLELRTSLTTMRMTSTRQPRFYIYEEATSRYIYSNSLAMLLQELEIKRGYKIDYTREYIFNIELAFGTDECGLMQIQVSVNGWIVYYDDYTLGT
ncbi:hypothetical protein D0T85_15460 [Bacteroides sp. 519]|nr:hypothetical protein [Bacteroides sp. 519]